MALRCASWRCSLGRLELALWGWGKGGTYHQASHEGPPLKDHL